MARVKNELYIFIFATLGMLGMFVLICLGHNHLIEYTFLGLNAAGLGGGIIKSIKGGKDDG